MLRCLVSAESAFNITLAKVLSTYRYYFLPSERLYHAQDFPIKARKQELDKFRDLIPTWDFNREKFDTTDLRHYLGATSSIKIDRGVFELDMRSIKDRMKSYIEQWNPDRNLHSTDWRKKSPTLYIKRILRIYRRSKNESLKLIRFKDNNFRFPQQLGMEPNNRPRSAERLLYGTTLDDLLLRYLQPDSYFPGSGLDSTRK